MSSECVVPYALRLPESLKGLLEDRAKNTRRSLNAEIIVILEATVRESEKADAAGTASTFPGA